jgi:hypothetical protein
MKTLDKESVEFLKKLEGKEWYNVLDRVFNYETLPDPIAYKCEFVSDYLLELNNAVVGAKDSDFLNTFHTILIQYYFDLPLSEVYYSRIYTLHWVLGNIKPKVDIAGKFYNQLYSGILNGIYHGNIHLNSSLLSLIHELPAIYDDSGMVEYLFSSIDRINDYSFFRVALRYFIEKKSANEYWDYFYRISHKYKNERFANVLTESLMDLRRYSGSFQKIYEKIDDIWDWYERNFPEIFKLIIDNLNTKYLGPNGKWDNDIHAKLLKAFINSSEYPLPPALLKEVWSKLENNKNRKKYITKLFKFKDRWKSKLHLDEICFDIYYLTTDLDSHNKQFYRERYNVSQESEIIAPDDIPVKLRNIIMKQTASDYYKKVKPYYKKVKPYVSDAVDNF